MARDVTDELLARLWASWGSNDLRAEWDGRLYGGGKLSQRFWEYHWTIRQARLTNESVVLDVGAGGTLFFARLLAPFVREVIAFDPEAPDPDMAGITVVRAHFSRERLGARDCSHVVCVSVIEHVPDAERGAFYASLDAVPRRVVLTLEHGTRAHGSNLTMHDLYDLGSAFKKHSPSWIEACPVWADNSFQAAEPLWRPLGLTFEPTS